MSERDQQPHESGRPAVQEGGGTGATTAHGASPAGAAPGYGGEEPWREQTTPGMTPIRGGAAAEPGQAYGTGEPGYASGGYAPAPGGYAGAPGGYPSGGHGPGGYGAGGQGYATGAQGGYPAGQGWGTGEDSTAPEYSSHPVAFRRPDVLAGLLLVLAGIAAGVSLLLRWLHGNTATGWDILRRGIDAAKSGAGRLFDTGLWEPMAVLAAGAVLFVLGLLMFLPARTHRVLGVLALLFALLAVVGVLTPMAQDGWKLSTYDTGMWFAVAVAVLGLLGALKAMLTGPRLGTQAPRG
jgi:hypothetical protein